MNSFLDEMLEYMSLCSSYVGNKYCRTPLEKVIKFWYLCQDADFCIQWNTFQGGGKQSFWFVENFIVGGF